MSRSSVLLGLILYCCTLAILASGCGGDDDSCQWLQPGKYKLEATAVSLNCPDFEAEVDYKPGLDRDQALCVERGVTADSVWELRVTGPGAAAGRLESKDCIWAIAYTKLP